jgi:hypothetical protein
VNRCYGKIKPKQCLINDNPLDWLVGELLKSKIKPMVSISIIIETIKPPAYSPVILVKDDGYDSYP